ncbi:MAG TPA: hypothetical protein VN641_04800 [Urbifossiella sp.]|nr:hypothetical protein [Urbifossiella sp.]
MAVPSVMIPDDAAHRRDQARGIDSAPPKRRVYLGRIRPKARPQCLRFAAYLRSEGATPPSPSLDYGAKAQASISRVYLNDRYGDCVIAGKAHELGVWSGNELGEGNVVLATDDEIYRQYQEICGPGDNGCVITDVLDAMKSRGFVAGGKAYPIDGYVAIDWTNKLEVQVALYLFGTLTLGINLPEAWTEGGDRSTWGETDTEIVGGHDVTAFGYDSDGVWIATWGGKRLIAWDAFTSTRWLEECYAQLAPLWYANAKLAPCGVDAAALQADLAKLAGGTIPSIDPTPTPPVPPVPVPPAPPVYSSYAGTAALSGTIRMPFGGTQALSLSGPVSLAPVASLARIVDRVGLEDPALHFNLGLLLQIIAAVAPVIAADIAAGKSIVEMLPDIAAALLPLLSRG